MRSVYKLIALFLFIGNTAVHAQKPDWQWAVTPAATSFNSSPVGVAVTPNGNLIMAGTFGGSVTFGNTLLPYGPIYIVEYDRNGNVIWAKATGGGTTRGVTPTSIALSPTGEIYIAGSFSAPTLTFGSTTLSLAGAQDVFLAKFDSTGNALWAKSAKSDGGATANSVCTDRSGNVAITGSYITTLYLGSGSLTPQPSSIDNVFIAKYNTSGTLQWAHTAGSYGQDDHGTGIAADTFGNFFISLPAWDLAQWSSQAPVATMMYSLPSTPQQVPYPGPKRPVAPNQISVSPSLPILQAMYWLPASTIVILCTSAHSPSPSAAILTPM